MKRLNLEQDSYKITDKNFTEADFPWIPLETRSKVFFYYTEINIKNKCTNKKCKLVQSHSGLDLMK